MILQKLINLIIEVCDFIRNDKFINKTYDFTDPNKFDNKTYDFIKKIINSSIKIEKWKS